MAENPPTRREPASEQLTHTRSDTGRLTVFLGYGPGVGKTYAMLEAAYHRQLEHTDVVVAWVEAHGATELQALLARLETVPPLMPSRQAGGQGVDVDAVLARQPQLAVIDDLASSNPAEARHRKRYLDIEELLAAGIDIYTTLNIGELESLSDVVEQITGLEVRETVPDRLFDQAHEIELVDLPPEELLQRFEEGVVSRPAESAAANQKFFRLGNLLALRELAMRRAAERIDEQMRAYMRTRAIQGPWPAAERLLVCVGTSPLSEKLVRSARRMAGELNAEWFALHVETPRHARLSQPEQERVWRTLRLAESLGAKTSTMVSQSVAEGVLDYASRMNITKVIVGRPLEPRWREILFGSVVDRIIRNSQKIDVYVISSQAAEARKWMPPHRAAGASWVDYLAGLVLVAAATLLAQPMRDLIAPTNLVMLYLVAVVLAAVRLGLQSAILTAFLSVLAFDFFFVPPRYTLVVADTEYLLTFAGLLVVGVVISTLVFRIRNQAQTAQRREEHTATLYALSRELAAAVDLNSVLETVMNHASQMFSPSVAVLLPENGDLEIHSLSYGVSLSAEELSVARWVFQHRQPAGNGTDTHLQVSMRFTPLQTAHSVVGVLGVQPKDPENDLAPEQTRLLAAFANQAALAIERVRLVEEVGQAELLRATEKLQRALLNSISHDLRTPLASITGVLSSLHEGEGLDPDVQYELVDTAWQEARRLNKLVGNLLDMSRIEADALTLTREPCDVEDLIGSALSAVSSRLGERPLRIDVAARLPFISADFVLVNQVLVNVIDNAVKYSPADSPITISAQRENQWVRVEVGDRGIGIPEQDLEKVFDKFYRVQRPDTVVGTGLGLAISKGITEAHGGQIWAESREGGGTSVVLRLPISGVQRDVSTATGGEVVGDGQ